MISSVEIDSVLQLNTQEGEVYKKILVSGQISKAELLDGTSISSENIDSVLTSLVDQKLLRKIPGMIDRYAALLPLGSTKQELEKASEDVALLGREIQSTAEEELFNLQTQLDSAKEALQSRVDEKISSLDQSISSLRTSVDSQVTSSQESVSSGKSSSSQKVSEKIQSAAQGVDETVTKFQNEAQGRIHAKSESVERSSSSAKSAQETIKAEAGADLQELDTNALENTKTESLASVSGVFSDANEQVQAINTRIISSVDTVETRIEQQVTDINLTAEAYKDQAETVLQETNQSIMSQTQSQIGRFDEHSGTFNENAKALQASVQAGIDDLTTIEQQTKQKLTGLSSELQESVTALETSIRSSTDDANSRLGQFLNDTDSKVSTHQQELESSVSSLLQQHSNQIKTQLQEQLTSFMEQTTGQIDQMLASFTSQLDSNSQQLSQSRAEMKAASVSSLSTAKQAIEGQVTNLISSTKEAQRMVFSNANESISTLTAEQQERLMMSQQQLEAYVNEIGTGFEEGKSSLQQWSKSLQQKINGHIEEQSRIYTEALQSSIQQQKAQIHSQTSALKTQTDETYNSINSQLQTSQNEVGQQLQSSIDSTIAVISNLHENMRQKFDLAVSQSRDRYNTLIDKNKSDMQELVSQLQQDTSVIKEDLSGTIGQQLDQVKQHLNTLVEEVYSQVNTLIQSVEGQVKQQLSQSEAIGKQIIQNVSELSSQATDSQIDAVKRTFDTYGQKYRQTTDTVSDKVTALASILDSVFKMQEETDTPTIKTTHVVGKSTIVKYIKEMISRMKSKMTILVPDISMIPDSIILELPMRAQITIISLIDEIENRDWVEKMHNATANVTLRNINERDRDRFNLIGAEREGEEIIVGTVDEGNNDYVGIASNSEQFVRILGAQLISEYSRGISMQLQK